MGQSIFLPDDTIIAIKDAAKKCCRSLNQQANYWIKLGRIHEKQPIKNPSDDLTATLKEDILKCIGQT